MNLMRFMLMRPVQPPSMQTVYSVRKVSPPYRGALMRVRDIATNEEIDIYHASYGNLAVDAIKAFLGDKQRTLNPTMMVDANEDGMADDWVLHTTGTGAAELSIDGGQKIEMTSSTLVCNRGVYQDIAVAAGSVVNLSIDTKTLVNNGRFAGRILIRSLDAANTLIHNLVDEKFNSEDWTTKTYNLTISGTNAEKIRIRLLAESEDTGDTGIVWYKNVTTYVSNAPVSIVAWYDQIAGRHISNVAAVGQPRLMLGGNEVNGRPIVRFDGVANALGTSLFIDTNGFTSLAISMIARALKVHNSTVNGGFREATFRIVESGSWGSIYLTAGTNKISCRFGTGQADNNIEVAGTYNNLMLLHSEKSGVNERLGHNFVQTPATKLTPISNQSTTVQFGRGSSFFSNVNISEFVMQRDGVGLNSLRINQFKYFNIR